MKRPKRVSEAPRPKKAPSVRAHEQITYRQGRAYTATEAKNNFGLLLDQVFQGATVVITKHQAPRAVVISMDKFHALQQGPQLKLNTLSAEFDALLSRMQAGTASAGMERGFNASVERLGKAAMDAVRKRG
jgi:prevent-host-death family protein